MKKLLSVVMVFLFVFTVCMPALATSSPLSKEPIMTPMDGFSWSYSSSDPSGGLGYYVTGTWTNGTTLLPKTLGAMGSGALSNHLLNLLGSNVEWWSVAISNAAAAIVAGLVFVATLYLDSTQLYYKIRVSPNSVLPGWYQKCEQMWYYDNARTALASSQTYYKFKA